MSQTLMRVACYECDYAVITPNGHIVTAHGLLLAHFAATGHYLMRPTTPEDLMQPYFVTPDGFEVLGSSK